MAKLNYKNVDSSPGQLTTNVEIEKGVWHFVTYGNDGVKIDMNLDYLDVEDLLTAQPFYFVRIIMLIDLDLTATIHIRGSLNDSFNILWAVHNVEDLSDSQRDD